MLKAIKTKIKEQNDFWTGTVLVSKNQSFEVKLVIEKLHLLPLQAAFMLINSSHIRALLCDYQIILLASNVHGDLEALLNTLYI